MYASNTVLIVEDNPELLDYLNQLLGRNDLNVITANCGKTALQILKDKTIDLVLQDIGLPDIDGYQVMNQILEVSPNTLVIVMTGDATIDSAVQALRCGAYDYLKKPFESIELLSSVNNALDRIKLEHKNKQAEAALQQSERQFRELVENSLIGISIIQNNQFIYQNPQCKKLFRPSNEKSVFKDLQTVHAEDRERVKKAYENIVSGAVDNVEIEFRFYPAGQFGNDSLIRWVQCRGTAIKYQGKDAVLLNAIDITQSKLLQQQLIIKNKMLSLGRVAAGIAHEIRNPLTGINTYLYTIEDLCDSDRLDAEDMEIIRQIITQIQVASNKIESVIRRVMDFSKPGAPKMVRTDINKSLEEAIELSAVTMRKNSINIKKSLDTNLPQCYADPHLIEQVVLNLITNAARAMEKSNGSPKLVEIKSTALNNTLCIQVADSGPGVPLELREKIFDPFFTTKEDGSGIGLNIAQRIVADHNGSISLGNSRWGGAEFTIELPIERRMNTR